jgi:outer membrane murein-binding lipoprotein Lpp
MQNRVRFHAKLGKLTCKVEKLAGKVEKLAGKVEKLACKEAFDYVHSFDIHKYE